MLETNEKHHVFRRFFLLTPCFSLTVTWGKVSTFTTSPIFMGEGTDRTPHLPSRTAVCPHLSQFDYACVLNDLSIPLAQEPTAKQSCKHQTVLCSIGGGAAGAEAG